MISSTVDVRSLLSGGVLSRVDSRDVKSAVNVKFVVKALVDVKSLVSSAAHSGVKILFLLNSLVGVKVYEGVMPRSYTRLNGFVRQRTGITYC